MTTFQSQQVLLEENGWRKSMSEEADRSVIRQIDELQRMSLPALRKKWSDLFGRDPGKFSQQYLVRRLAYRIQELIYVGLSREARDQLKAWAESPEKMRDGYYVELIDNKVAIQFDCHVVNFAEDAASR